MIMKTLSIISVATFSLLIGGLQAEYAPLSSEYGLDAHIEQGHSQFINERRARIPAVLNPFLTPPKARLVIETPDAWEAAPHPWRRGITATIFWVGEKASERNPTPNHSSAWDPNWQIHYGGVDSPGDRNGFQPRAFTPKLNPFYIALPYNDLSPNGGHFPEASKVIPWFWKSYKGSWSSVCKDRWVAIHYRGRVCYAQWEDCGPFNTDDWKYVFKGHAPKPNINGNAGIDISPAVRDYLKIRSGYRVSWKFAESYNIPPGPWSQWVN